MAEKEKISFETMKNVLGYVIYCELSNLPGFNFCACKNCPSLSACYLRKVKITEPFHDECGGWQ